MTDVLIKRELLERVWLQLANYDTGKAIGAVLDAAPCDPSCAETCVRASMCATCMAIIEGKCQPEGGEWQLVPIEPTDEMMAAALKCYGNDDDCYRVMLAAAPSAPATVQGVNAQLLEALNGMLLHIREPESESEFQWPEHFKKQKAAFAAARAAIAAAQEGWK